MTVEEMHMYRSRAVTTILASLFISFQLAYGAEPAKVITDPFDSKNLERAILKRSQKEDKAGSAEFSDKNISSDGASNADEKVGMEDRRQNKKSGFILTAMKVLYFEAEGLSLEAPADIFYDTAKKEMYVADRGRNIVVVYNEKGMPVFSLGYNGELDEPSSVMVDMKGRIYVISDSPRKIKIFNYRGEFISEFRFPGAPDAKEFVTTAMTVDSRGKLYFAVKNEVLVYDDDYHLLLRFGKNENESARVSTIMDMAVDKDGIIYLVDVMGTPVQVYSSAGKYLRGWGTHDPGPGNFSLPSGIIVDSGGRLLIIDIMRQGVSAFTTMGEFIGDYRPFGSGRGQMRFPTAIAQDSDGRFFIVDGGNRRIQIFSESKALAGPAKSGTKVTDAPLPTIPLAAGFAEKVVN